jgi:hypothetical protein
MSPYHENVGALPKCWRFIKMSRTVEMLASYENVGVLLNCRRTIEMLASYENVSVLWKCWRPIQRIWTHTISWHYLFKQNVWGNETTPEECPYHWGADTGRRQRRW